MKKIFLLLSVLILPLISLWAGDDDDVLRAERELALCYQNTGATCIEQGVIEDSTHAKGISGGQLFDANFALPTHS